MLEKLSARKRKDVEDIISALRTIGEQESTTVSEHRESSENLLAEEVIQQPESEENYTTADFSADFYTSDDSEWQAPLEATKFEHSIEPVIARPIAQDDRDVVISPFDVETAFNSPVIEDSSDDLVIDTTDKFESWQRTMYSTLNMFERRKASATASRTERHARSKVLYKKRNYTDFEGNSIEYKLVVCNADWGNFYSNITEDRIKNLDLLQTEVTNSVYKYFGGFDRIHDIVVFDNRIIINGFAYTPKLKDLESNASKFPLDTYDYIVHGQIAPLFDWGYLEQMKNLRSLQIETYEFVNDYIVTGLGWTSFKLAPLFTRLLKLQVISIQGDIVKRDNPNGVTEGNVDTDKETIERNANSDWRFKELFADVNFSIYETLGAGQNFFVDSLRTYAKNRGNKNFFAYSIGVVARSVGALASTTLNQGTRLLGGTLKAIGKIFKDGMTPIE